MSRYFVFLLCCFTSSVCLANDDIDPVCQPVSELESDWAKVRYQTPTNMRNIEFEAMLISLNHAPLACLKKAEYQIVEAMIKGSMVKQQSGLVAIKKIKQIKRLLDKATKNNPAAMNGLGWTLLGLLYDKAPGWPFSIGDDEQAEKAYLKGLEYNPVGIDANFYYGDFLRRKGLKQQAREYLLKASQSNQQIGREIAHQGRMSDVLHALAKLDR